MSRKSLILPENNVWEANNKQKPNLINNNRHLYFNTEGLNDFTDDLWLNMFFNIYWSSRGNKTAVYFLWLAIFDLYLGDSHSKIIGIFLNISSKDINFIK